jgi:hypothetical protein
MRGGGSHDVSMLSILVVCFFKKKTKDVEVIGVQSRVSETTRDSLEQPLSLQHIVIPKIPTRSCFIKKIDTYAPAKMNELYMSIITSNREWL